LRPALLPQSLHFGIMGELPLVPFLVEIPANLGFGREYGKIPKDSKGTK